MKASDIMTDGDVAKMLRISLDAFQRRCRVGFKPGEIDLLKADPVMVGGMRRWFRADVEKVLAERPKVGDAGAKGKTRGFGRGAGIGTGAEEEGGEE